MTDSPKRILVVEDNPINRRVASGFLRSWGFEVDLAENGRDGVEAFQAGHYAVILMDLHMPVMDGLEAAREIRRLEGGDARIPIIAVTANVMTGTREAALEAGMDDFIAKPIQADLLRAAIDRLVQGGHAPSPAAAQTGETDPPLLDQEILKALLEFQEEGEPSLIGELVGLYLQDLPDRIEALKKAASEKDSPALKQIAHSLRGSSASLGAEKIAAACTALEGAAAAGDLSDLPARLDAILSLTDPTVEALQQAASRLQ